MAFEEHKNKYVEEWKKSTVISVEYEGIYRRKYDVYKS